MKRTLADRIKTIGLFTVSCFVALTGVITLSGCAVLDTHQAKLDQKQLRDALMDYNEDQILDNLIRAYNGLPIAHFEIKTVTATVASKIDPSVGYGRTITSNRFPGGSSVATTNSAVTGPVPTVTHTVVKTVGSLGVLVGTVTEPFTSGLSAERSNNILVDVKPMDEVKIYAAYAKFLNTGAPERNSTNTKSKTEEELDTSKVTTIVTDPTSVVTTTETAKNVTDGSDSNKPEVTGTETKTLDKSTTTRTEKVPKAGPAPELVIRQHADVPLKAGLKPLMRSLSPPPSGAVLVGPKQFKDKFYYWVPKAYLEEFFALCVATTTKGFTSSAAQAAASEKSEGKALKEELEDFNSLQRLKLGTPQ